MEESGDLAIIGGRPFPRAIAAKRHKLEEWIRRESFPQVMEAIAYTWFNRFMALRYMEVNGFLEHGCRVLSNPSNSPVPEILDRAAEIDLPGLNKEKVIELKMDGGKDAELYRLLLVAQCNALHVSMPFLFERIDDETELLLPDNLLHSDSLIRKLVTEIDEEDWKEVEIIGWLYQFYISEKKDEVFEGLKKNQKITPENIPAATQLFTPHWIVRYLVENSLGRLWMLNHPDSRLIERMEYYIKPQDPETDFLRISSPEELKICDPACGSGHMLVYAFDLLHAIYEELGYERSEIPGKILTHNLYGIEIDERAGELAAFALTMKARGQYRRFFQTNVRPHICVLKKIIFEPNELKNYVDFIGRDLFAAPLQTTLRQFEEADNFGSLIRPEVTDVASMLKTLESKDVSGQLFLSLAHKKVLQVLQQADYLSPKYHVVIANPPYMGGKGMNGRLGAWLKDNYADVKSDLFSAFVVRCSELAVNAANIGIMSPNVWMYISSYEKLRDLLTGRKNLTNLVELPLTGFKGATVQICAYNFENRYSPNSVGGYVRLVGFRGGDVEMAGYTMEAIKNPDCGWFYYASAADFKKIPGRPIAYSATANIRGLFTHGSLNDHADTRLGMATADNNLFLRLWPEVSVMNAERNATSRIDAEASGKKWFPYQKGGDYRKWYGNLDFYVNWEKDGFAIQNFKDNKSGKVRSHNYNLEFIFKNGITWNALTSGKTSARLSKNSLFDNAGSSLFVKKGITLEPVMGLINSNVMLATFPIISPTLNYQPGDIAKLPALFPEIMLTLSITTVQKLIAIARKDWDSYETSWDFTCLPLLHSDYSQPTLKATYKKLRDHWREMTLEMLRLETENNRIFIDAYNLQNELTPEVPISEITLTCNPHYRYGGEKNKDDLESLLLTDTIKELISYAVGCMMGRYSLDHPGIVYAKSGNVGFDPAKYDRFLADDDGIVPVMDRDWFPDDAAYRFEEILRVAWSPETLEENLKFIAAALSPKGGETPRESIRRYISTQFFKDHLQTYKKRPIYWLFTSGKQRAFECLVYLHRYNESTLSRMRNEYVTPLQGKFTAQIDFLSNEIGAATSTAERNRLQKQLDTLKKKKDELASFDELLRHYADQRIALDLDDGVKVNYGKFGNLLADVRAVTGAGE